MSHEQSATDARNRFDISFSSMTLRQGVVEEGAKRVPRHHHKA
jgi:hypothetical protein